MINNSDKIRYRYDRIAGMYDLMEKVMEGRQMTKWRKTIIEELEGKVLEVGVGTGNNIQFYPDNIDITAIDFSSKMLKKASDKSAKLNKSTKLIEMDAQQMVFEDNTFDTVFSTCVFCSVPDPIKGLKEIRRVCKNNGRIILLEHVKSEKLLIGPLMDIFNPLVVGLYGANINRNTVENTKNAGFSNVVITDLWLDIVKKIEIQNDK